MSWAEAAVRALEAGESVRARPRGGSMTPRIRSGEEVVIRPLREGERLRKGRVVLVRVSGSWYLHLIKRADRDSDRYLIANNHGRVNGWVARSAIRGVADGV